MVNIINPLSAKCWVFLTWKYDKFFTILDFEEGIQERRNPAGLTENVLMNWPIIINLLTYLIVVCLLA